MLRNLSLLTRPRLDDPLAGDRAALLARDVAKGRLLRYAEEARGAGRSWDEVAEALGIEATEDDEPRAVQAYLLLVEGRPLPNAEPSSWWHRLGRALDLHELRRAAHRPRPV